MFHLKNILSNFIIILLLISCSSNNSTSPEDISSAGSGINTSDEKKDYEYDSSFTKEESDFLKEIDKTYPYYNVGLNGFGISGTAPKGTKITIDEKTYVLEALALMRLSVNKPEFVNAIKKYTFYSSVNDSYSGSKYNIKMGDIYNNDRLIEIFKKVSYNTMYVKNYHTTQIAYADVGQSLYVRYGYQSNIKFGKQILLPNLNWKTELAYGMIFNCAALLFHEHMHNLGFDHKGSFNTPLDFQNMLPREVFRTVSTKYALEYEKLKKYYKLRYRKFLTSDTI